jgi:phage shock protein PspC (stress-responsive transcriptional regulator)
MVTEHLTSSDGRPVTRPSLILEIFPGRGAPRQFPVRIRSLSARGVILTAGQAPDDLDLESCASRDAVIHLPDGEMREIRGSLIWARLRGRGGKEVVFGLELSNSNLKVRRALEEQLLGYPQDLKNMWDHWDAVYDDYEVNSFGQPGAHPVPKAHPAEPTIPPTAVRAAPAEPPAASSESAFYWVGLGGVLAGLAVYFLSPENYRLFGVILAIYGTLTIAGKSVWSLMQRSPRSQEKPG